ncbi:hypothetical protein GCM10011608_49980 [Micromonospora sonchi]|uniref:Uncharacterized protein n=1 Tax=Micromonospora sonchi TaxID=1763543 RepID=A0A917U6P4_9ACTN|nr:hypothetical protein [Micromonospora sonchi]GGM58950.1 hypothetical protein GCM10011608_49980 [Micromonospora sonchi]
MSLSVEFVIWWVALTAAWAATVSQLTLAELLVGAACALVGAVVAVGSRRALGHCWRPDVRWLAWSGRLAVAVPVDTVRLLVQVTPRMLPGRDVPGRLSRLRPPADEAPARAAFRRAWGTFVLSATPSSVVLDWPPDGAPVVLHLLGPGRTSMGKTVVR